MVAAAGSLLREYLTRVLPDTDVSGLSLPTVAVAAALDVVAAVDPETARDVLDELESQRGSLKLIASENFASLAVLLAMGNWLSDKYAEGAPGHRFYAGCEHVDRIEARAAGLARELFGAEHAYVQPHSGIDANLVAFWAVLTHRIQAPALQRLDVERVEQLSDDQWETLRRDLGDQTLLSMSLDAGGHLTHGFRANVSGKLFGHAALARQTRPLIVLAGYSSYPRALNFRILREIADSVDATLMVDMAHFAGLVGGKVFTGDLDPVAHAHIVTTTTHKTLRGPRGGMILCDRDLADTVDRGCPLVLGGPLPHVIAAKAVALTEASGPAFADYAQQIVTNARTLADELARLGATVLTACTDNHLVLIDVRPYGLTGRQAESALRETGLTANRNIIPHDPNGAWYTSGLRLGTPALTSRGMKTAQMIHIAQLIDRVLSATRPAPDSSARYHLDNTTITPTAAEVSDLLVDFPLYPELALT